LGLLAALFEAKINDLYMPSWKSRGEESRGEEREGSKRAEDSGSFLEREFPCLE